MKNLKKQAIKVLAPVHAHYYDLEIDYGKGCYLYDFKGNQYLDLSAGLAVASTGHCHPKVVKAIQKQSEKLIHACSGIVYYEPNIQLAQKLGKILGNKLTSVFFTQSGSEAIETAIKLAKYITKKTKILAFKGGFHGRTLGALSVTTSKDKYRNGYAPLLPGIEFFPYPYLYRTNKIEDMLIKELRKKIQKSSKDLAAIIIEPVLGEGGYVPAPKKFLTELKALCQKNNILLIFDEIQTGFGRTGKWFCFQNYNIAPDIIALAKGIASGMPLGACVARPELMEKWTPGAHGGTFVGNPVTCAAGIATLKVLEKTLPKVNPLSKKAMAFLKEKLTKCPIVGDIRGLGLMIGIELVKDKKTKTPAPEKLNIVLKKGLEKGIITLSCGINDNVLRIMPPLVISEKELMHGLKIITNILNNI